MEKEKSKYPPGDFGIWILIYIELFTFGLFFIGFAFSRRLDIETFHTSQLLLDQRIGVINTILLITSSYFVVQALKLVKQKDFKKQLQKAVRYLFFAMLLGVVFLILKLFELGDKFAQGIHLSTNQFFMFYFILIVFHFAHVLLGLVILYNLFCNTKKGLYSPKDHKGFESGASYWHMVDLLWVVLFALIYLLR